MSSVAALLTDPDAFFRERSPDTSLRGPVAVVAAVALVSAVAGALQFSVMNQLFAELGGGAIVSLIQLVTFGASLVGPFVVWLIYAGVFQGISLVFDGDGEFSTTLALVGWGFLPSVFGALASLAINYYRFEVQGVTLPAEVTAQSVQQFSRSIASGPLVALSAGLGIVFTLWSAFLWVFALKHARNLSVRDAALTVALPVLVGVALSGFGLLNAL